MSIREVITRAENLKEQGEQIKRRQEYFQQEVRDARSRLIAAQARLEAASRTDENGNPVGDVAAAQADYRMAQMMLESAQRNLDSANREEEGVRREKMATVDTIEQYKRVEKGNLSKLSELQKKRFGSNVAAFMADLAARMNAGEQARVMLLESMGIAATAQHFSAGAGAGGLGGAQGQQGGAATLRSYQDGIKMAFLQRANAILNDPNLTMAEKSAQLHAEREKMMTALHSSEEDDAQFVRKRTRGGDSGTERIPSPSERYEQLRDDYLSDCSRVLNDASLTDEEKSAQIDALNQEYGNRLEQENLGLAEYGAADGAHSFFTRFFGTADLEGIDRERATSPSVGRTNALTYNDPKEVQKILQHPRFSGMTEFNNRRAYVFGMNDARLNKLPCSQGNNDKGWKYTCGITQASGICMRAGIDETENTMVHYCGKKRLCHKQFFHKELSGGTSPANIAKMLTDKGVPSHFDSTVTVEEIANLVENNHGVIVGVNAGFLWRSYNGSAMGSGGANHAISVIGTVRDEQTHAVIGFFINDTGRGLEGDRKRLISLSDFTAAFEVPGHSVIATDNPFGEEILT